MAAPQVGVNVRMMVYNQEGKKGEGQEHILVNPRIISTSKSTDVMEEGCLSFQDLSTDLHIKGNVTVSCVTDVCEHFTDMPVLCATTISNVGQEEWS